MKILGIIPARKGSKGIRNKNIKKFAGKPLIYWTIKVAINSNLDKVIVSTDSDTIIKYSKSYGAEVPFKRPLNISQDKSKTIDVIKHAINFYKKKKINFDAIMLLQPTCPLINTADINNAINILKKNISISSVISVQDVNAFHPARMKFLGKKNILKDPTFSEKYENQPRQELRKMYIRSGLIYLTRVKNVIKYNSIKGKKSYGIITPSSRAFNIDDISDFKIAELIKKNKVY